LLRALPRSFQVTPDIPDRRRATQQKEVRTATRSTASKRVSSPPVGTFSTAPDVTDAANHNSKPPSGSAVAQLRLLAALPLIVAERARVAR
jgi:hypothetical protein